MDFGRLLADPIMGAASGEKKIDVRVFERLENLEEGTRVLVVSWRTAFCNKLAASARIPS